MLYPVSFILLVNNGGSESKAEVGKDLAREKDLLRV
jgi:hypothetical protein